MSAQRRIKVATMVDELETINAEVETFAEEQAWPPDLVFKVTLALEELGLNIISYGYEPNVDSPEIEITLTSEPDTLTIEISDDGRPFDPLSDAPAPDVTASVADREVGGLGIHLVRNMMDVMHYRREAGRNILTLIVHRS